MMMTNNNCFPPFSYTALSLIEVHHPTVLHLQLSRLHRSYHRYEYSRPTQYRDVGNSAA